jgi:archaellum component FlaC
MTKITDTRIEELEKLTERKEKLKEKLQKKKDQMKVIQDAMERGETVDLIMSSSTAALNNRGKKAHSDTGEDLLDILEMAIERIEEMYEEVTQELEGLKELMGTS